MKDGIQPYKILSFCTGNSARSIFGEYLIRRAAPHLFRSFSAGAQPVGRVNPYALRVLKQGYHIDASDARSKGCEECIDLLCALPLDKLDRLKLEALTREIGLKGGEEAGGAGA